MRKRIKRLHLLAPFTPLALALPADAVVTPYVSDNFDSYNVGDAILDVDPTHWYPTITAPEGTIGTAKITFTDAQNPGNKSLKFESEAAQTIRPRFHRDLSQTPASAENPMHKARVSFSFNYNYRNSLSFPGGMNNKSFEQDNWFYVRTSGNQIIGQIQANGGVDEWRFGNAYHIGNSIPAPRVRPVPPEAPDLFHTLDIDYDFAAQTATYFLDGVQEWSESTGGLLNSTNGLGFIIFENGISSPEEVESNQSFLDNVMMSADIGPEWKVNSDGNWTTAGNWNGPVPNSATAIANFGHVITQAHTVTVDAPQTAGVINFYDTDAYTIDGTSTLTLGGGRIDVSEGDHTISAPLQLGANTTFGVAGGTLTLSNLQDSSVTVVKDGGGTLLVNAVRAGSLNVALGTVRVLPSGGGNANISRLSSLIIANNNALLNLTDNDLIVTSGGPGSWDGSAYTGVTGQIVSGRGNGTWNGTAGIVTSQTNATNGSNYHSIGVALASDVRPNTATETAIWSGQTITGTDTLVMYTYGGDANLDGKLNIDDYVRIDQGISAGLTGWTNGDFNYDGKVNIDDYTTVIDSNIGNQAGDFPTGPGAGSAGVSAVPEPGSTSILALVTAISLRRCRRRAE